MALQFFEHAEPIELGHVDVEKYGRWRIVPDAPDGFPAIAPKRNVIVRQKKSSADELQNETVVFSDEYSMFGWCCRRHFTTMYFDY